MLPPKHVLDIKKPELTWIPGICGIGLGLSILTGCTPAGPKALLQGERLLEQGNTSAAISKFEKAVELIPDNAMARLYLGLAKHKIGDPDQAIQHYQDALTINRDLTEARYNLGCLYLENRNPQAAVKELEIYTNARKEDPEGWSKLGDAYLTLNRTAEAHLCFLESLKYQPANPSAQTKLGLIALKEQKPRSAYNHFLSAVNMHPDYAPARLNLGVVSQHYIKDLPLALEHYRLYTQMTPAPPGKQEVLKAMQAIQISLAPPKISPPETGDPLEEKTVPDSAQVASTDPKETGSPEAASDSMPVESGSTSEGEPVEMAEIPTAMNAEDPDPLIDPTDMHSPEIDEIGGESLVDAGPEPKPEPEPEPGPVISIEEIDLGPEPESSRIDPIAGVESIQTPRETPNAGAELRPWEGEAASAILKNEAFVRRHASAIPLPPQPGYRDYVYLDIGSLAPGDRPLAIEAFNRGYEAQKKGELGEAIKAYEEAWQRDPSFFDAHYNLGVCSALGGDQTRSMRAYERALALEPGSVAARYNFAVMLKKAGYVRDSAIQLIRILEDEPGEARVHFTLANIYAQQLRLNTEAMRHYKKVLELNPLHPQANEIRKWIATRP